MGRIEMTVTQKIKNYILNDCRMDSVGIAPTSAFMHEPAWHDPEDILPGAKSVIVFTKRISRGAIQAAFRANEDKNFNAQAIYAAYGSNLVPNMNLFFMQFNIAQYIERNFGYTTTPIPSGPLHNVTSLNKPLPAFVGSKQTYFQVNPMHAAMAAGLGELGWNNQLITKENGPRQRIGLVITTLELEYDKPSEGRTLCDPEKCGICEKVCPTHAFCKGEIDSFEVAGRTYETAHIDANACAVASLAFRKEFGMGRRAAIDQIMTDHPTDEEMAEAFAKKPMSHTTVEHYPIHFCNKCMLYCPIGGWQEKYGDTGLSDFKAE